MSGAHEDFFYGGVDEAQLRRERAKAREMRKSRWWANRLSQGVCHYCGGKFAARDLTMDHIVPLARGSTSSKGNTVACCKECNTLKKTMLPIEWAEYMARLARPGEEG
jgi:5-methylcytosine-specific restriction endonuclease McrA